MQRRSNVRLAGMLSLIIVGMVGLTAAAVPLYDLLCRATVWAGTPRIASELSGERSDQAVEILFNADVSPDLPWSFRPVERRQEVRLGEQSLGFYEAHNHGKFPIVGTAVFNVTPLKVGNHFVKVDCFCFEAQRLDPGETVQMPVSFYVDPSILDDGNTSEVKQITLSYTFFVDEDETEALRQKLANSRPEINEQT